MRTIKTEQPLGYQIQIVHETVDICKARDILVAKKQNRYTSAIRSGMQAELTRHVWICPYCGERIPAYSRYLRGTGEAKAVQRQVVEDWASLQLSLFDAPHAQLNFNTPICNGETVCPRCRKESVHSTATKEITFVKDKHRLTVSAEISSIRDIFSLKWASSSLLKTAFPLYETVIFNFRKGTTHLKLHDALGIIYAISDITQKPESWCDVVLFEALTENKRNQRMLKRLFTEQYQTPLPFPSQELSLRNYVLLTRFVGYARCFYTAIPFADNSGRIDGSFKKIAKQLHWAGSVPDLYERYGLPKAKSIRKQFFENSGFLFYADECRALTKLIPDINNYRRLICCNAFYDILSQMHLYPGVLDYYRDYIAVKGVRSLIDNLEKRLAVTNYDAVIYAAMSPQCKRIEQQKWKDGKAQHESVPVVEYHDDDDGICYIKALPQPLRYSIPMHTVSEKIQPCVINGFYFAWLFSTKDYISAGKALANCLKQWESRQNPVIAIFKDSKVVGAIEVNIDSHCVEQARTMHNELFEEGSALDCAYRKWLQRYALKTVYME